MNDTKTLTSKCPKCKGTGFEFFVDSEGYESCRPCSCRFETVSNNLLKESGFPEQDFARMTLDTFKTETQEQKEMKALAEKFVKEGGHWLGFFGKSGAGKTHLCIAVCQELVKTTHQRLKYSPYRTMVRELRSNIFDQEKHDDILHDLIETDILYIDDLLKLSQDQKGETLQDELRVLYDVVNERYLRNKTTIFSSEYSMLEIVEIDEALGSRIRELIGDYGYKCKGKNQRIENARKEK